MSLRPISVVLAAVLAAVTLPGESVAQKRRPYTAPEAFTSSVQARTTSGASATSMRIHIDRYTAEDDRKTMTDALAHGGYGAFVQALRNAPAVGHLEVGDLKFTLRWSREQPTEKGGRTIVLATDAPVYFLGGGRADAKPRDGFHLAIVQLTVDDFGIGTGTMAAAARVKPDGQGGVLVEDYAEEPIKLTYVHRVVG